MDPGHVVSIGLLRESLRGDRAFGRTGVKSANKAGGRAPEGRAFLGIRVFVSPGVAAYTPKRRAPEQRGALWCRPMPVTFESPQWRNVRRGPPIKWVAAWPFSVERSGGWSLPPAGRCYPGCEIVGKK